MAARVAHCLFARSKKKLTMSDATIIREVVQPLTRSAQDYDSLLALIGDARLVLPGEASHGTHEFYAQCAAITKRLIAERGLLRLIISGRSSCWLSRPAAFCW